MKVTKKMRRELLKELEEYFSPENKEERYSSSDYAYYLFDVCKYGRVVPLNGLQLVDLAEEYCDSRCANGYFSRWTNWGDSLYFTMEEIAMAFDVELERLRRL